MREGRCFHAAAVSYATNHLSHCVGSCLQAAAQESVCHFRRQQAMQITCTFHLLLEQCVVRLTTLARATRPCIRSFDHGSCEL